MEIPTSPQIIQHGGSEKQRSSLTPNGKQVIPPRHPTIHGRQLLISDLASDLAHGWLAVRNIVVMNYTLAN